MIRRTLLALATAVALTLGIPAAAHADTVTATLTAQCALTSPVRVLVVTTVASAPTVYEVRVGARTVLTVANPGQSMVRTLPIPIGTGMRRVTYYRLLDRTSGTTVATAAVTGAPCRPQSWAPYAKCGSCWPGTIPLPGYPPPRRSWLLP